MRLGGSGGLPGTKETWRSVRVTSVPDGSSGLHEGLEELQGVRLVSTKSRWLQGPGRQHSGPESEWWR